MYWLSNRRLITEELMDRGFMELYKDTYFRDGIYITLFENGFNYLLQGVVDVHVNYRDMLGINTESIVLNAGRLALPA